MQNPDWTIVSKFEDEHGNREIPLPEDLKVGDEIEVPGTIWGEPLRSKITRVHIFYEVAARPGSHWFDSVTAYRRSTT